MTDLLEVRDLKVKPASFAPPTAPTSWSRPTVRSGWWAEWLERPPSGGGFSNFTPVAEGTIVLDGEDGCADTRRGVEEVPALGPVVFKTPTGRLTPACGGGAALAGAPCARHRSETEDPGPRG